MQFLFVLFVVCISPASPFRFCGYKTTNHFKCYIEKQRILLDTRYPDFKEDLLRHRGGARLTDSGKVKYPT